MNEITVNREKSIRSPVHHMLDWDLDTSKSDALTFCER